MANIQCLGKFCVQRRASLYWIWFVVNHETIGNGSTFFRFTVAVLQIIV